MSDTIYIAETLIGSNSTVTVTDDGTGSDTLTVSGVYTAVVEFTLGWFTSGGQPTSASVIYYIPNGSGGFTGRRLIVEGVIENATGSDGRDFIQGNVLGNVLWGDAGLTGPGLGDTLWGGEGNDTIHGGSGDDEVKGDNGNDLLYGEAGTDLISGGGGTDTIEGGAGADVLSGGGDYGDVLSYAGSAAGVNVKLEFGAATTGTGGDAAGDTITGFADVVGSGLSDRLEDLTKGTVAFGYNANRFDGGDGSDSIFAGGGNDTLIGGQGNDDLFGELGNDEMLGADGFDYFSGGEGKDTIRGGNDRDRIYGGADGDTLYGDAGNDLIFANEGGDRVLGGDGDDDMAGQAGIDRMSGGRGADHFLFFTLDDAVRRATGPRETITDFNAAKGDRLEFQLPFGTVSPLVFRTPGTALAEGEISYRSITVDGVASIEVVANLDSDSKLEFGVVLLGVTSFGAGDFIS